MKWDGATARAVVPLDELSRAPVPVAGTAALASASAYPYGVGVYVDGEPQPLYWVSAEAAEARARNVEEGWYVLALPGKDFVLHVTNCHKDGNGTAAGKALDDALGACAEVYVDGVNTLGGNSNGAYQLKPAGTELKVPGYTETEEFNEAESYGKAVMRQFSFNAVNPVQQANGNEDTHIGLIELRIYVGRLAPNAHQQSYRSQQVRAQGPVIEQSASKCGRSVGVQRDGKKLLSTCHRMPHSVQRGAVDATVKLFVRPRFWLESRSILGKDGAVWVPLIDRTPIAVDDSSGGLANPVVDDDVAAAKGKAPQASDDAAAPEARRDEAVAEPSGDIVEPQNEPSGDAEEAQKPQAVEGYEEAPVESGAMQLATENKEPEKAAEAVNVVDEEKTKQTEDGSAIPDKSVDIEEDNAMADAEKKSVFDLDEDAVVEAVPENTAKKVNADEATVSEDDDSNKRPGDQVEPPVAKKSKVIAHVDLT